MKFKKFLSIILTVVLIVCALPVSASNLMANAVSVSNEIDFETALANGGEINITSSFSWPTQINITKSVTINGNGHTLTGRLQFGGSAEVNLNNVNLMGPSEAGDVWRVTENAKLTVSGGSMKGNGTGSGDALLWIMGSTTAGSVVILKDGVKLDSTGGGNMCINMSTGACGKLIIEDAEMVSKAYGMRFQSATAVEFLGGSLTVKGTSPAIDMTTNNETNLIIGKTDGTGPVISNTTNATSPLMILNSTVATTHTIYDGTFINNGSKKMFEIKNQAKLIIKGGIFSEDPSEYVDKSICKVTQNDDTWDVVDTTIPIIKKQTVSTFAELNDAILENIPEIEIIGTIYASERLGGFENKQIKFTGDGEVIFNSTTDSGFHIYGGCDITFDGPSFKVTDSTSNLMVLYGIDNIASLTIKKGTFIGEIEVKENATLTIEDGEFSSNGTRPVIKTTDSTANIIVTGGTFTSNGGNIIDLRSGILSVTGGSFTNHGTGNIFYVDSSQTDVINIEGATINSLGEGALAYISPDKTLVFNNVTINKGNGALKSGKGTVALQVGTYDFDPTEYVNEKIHSITETDGQWTVIEKVIVPEGSKLYFASNFDEWNTAIENFSDGDIIYISNSIVDTKRRIIANKKVTFVGDGEIIFQNSSSQTGFWFSDGSEAVFDGPSLISEQAYSDDRLLIVSAEGSGAKLAKVTINKGNFTGEIQVQKNAKLVVNDGNFVGGKKSSKYDVFEITTANTFSDGSSLVVNGGNFAVGTDKGCVFNINGGSATITGGTYTCTGKTRFLNITTNADGDVKVANANITNSGENYIFGHNGNHSLILENVTATHTKNTANSYVLIAGENSSSPTVVLNGCNFTSVGATVELLTANVTFKAEGEPSYVTSRCSTALVNTGSVSIVNRDLITFYDKKDDGESGGSEEIFYSGVTGDCTWSIEGTTLTISGNGKMGDYNVTSIFPLEGNLAPWTILTVNEIVAITDVVIEEGVTNIGDAAFFFCVALQNITIPSSVKEINDLAFTYCLSLSSITIPASVEIIGPMAFAGCTSIKSVTISEGVTSIGNSAFDGCTGLTNITIPDSVTNIGASAFSGCTGLTNITIPDSVTSIDNYAFSGCTSLTSITIPDSVTSIGNGAFSGCTSLTSVTISDGVTSIGDYAFSGCTGLTNITIPDSVINIANYAFSNTALYNDESNWENDTLYIGDCLIESKASGSYIIKQGTRVVADNAFRGNELTAVSIPDSIERIGKGAFGTCSYLSTINLPDKIISIGYNAFSGTAYESSHWEDGAVYIGKNLVSVNKNVISENYRIKPGTVSIADGIFDGCTNLTSIYIPKSVKNIGSAVFNGCTSLKNVYYYCATQEEWDSVSIGDNNEVLLNADIKHHCASDWIEKTPVSCTQDGEKYTICLECEEILQTEITPALGHYYVANKVLPTCTQKGYIKYVCKLCQDEYITDEVEATGHTYTSTVTAPTCTEEGYTTHTCHCKDSYVDTIVPALGHSYSDVVTPPTCTEDGYTTHKCDRCDDSYTDTTVEMLGHDYHEVITPPTCTQNGYTTYTCSRCDDSYKGNYVSSLGHSLGDWVINYEPTCTSTGRKTRYCSTCSYSTSQTISALGHNYESEWTTDLKPTCTQDGSKSHHCTRCSAKTDITVIEKYGHAYDSWKYESVPTCTVEGKIVCSCLLCGDKKTIFIEPYGHDFSTEWTIDVNPTCVLLGVKSHHCTRCDEVCDETSIPASGHTYTASVTTPTCTDSGYTIHTCSTCGNYYKTDYVDALGHSFTHFAKKDATCNENGYEAYDVCSICDYTTYTEIMALGHDYQLTDGTNYKCTHCNNVISGDTTHHYIKNIVKATAEQNGYTQYTCTDCGYTYKTDVTEYITSPKLSVSNSIVGAGKTFVLTVSISNNPGIYSFTLDVDYDKENLTLSEVRNLNKLGGDLSNNGDKILWLNNTGKDSLYNGEVLQLVFTASPYAVAQDYSVSLTYNTGNITNTSLEDVNLAVESGVVTVENFTAGDLNNDGVVNNKDLVLMSEIIARNYKVYKAGTSHHPNNLVRNYNLFGKVAMDKLKNYDIVVLGITINRVAIDCNNDGVINNHDLLTMMKYLRGEDITIK